jgi:uroporphyrin-III C-methyltransferase
MKCCRCFAGAARWLHEVVDMSPAQHTSARLPGKVWFVGAGPGSADLLTVRAVRILSSADIVLHDALMSDEVLEWAPIARHIAVGKRSGGVSTEQRFIDRTLVECARQHAVVVRLKGGDPTVFARLDEEIEALDAAGIDWEIVPGITAASSAAAAAGHSLTRRGVSRSVQIVTPRLGRGEAQASDWAEGLTPAATVVLYMAGQIAGECAAILMSSGFASETPVVCVHGASWPTQSIDRTTLGALAVAGLAVDERPVALLVGAAVAARARDSAQGARDGAELFHDCANRIRDPRSIWPDLVRYA